MKRWRCTPGGIGKNRAHGNTLERWNRHGWVSRCDFHPQDCCEFFLKFAVDRMDAVNIVLD
jgi:hypothetical protein